MSYRTIKIEPIEELNEWRIKHGYDVEKYDDYGELRELNVPPITWQEIEAFDRLGIADISKLIADTVLAPDNQIYQAIATGKSGTGKSYSIASIYRLAGMRIAHKLDGDLRWWPKYFDYRRSFAVSNVDKIVALMKDQTPYLLKCYDDALEAFDRLFYWTDEHHEYNVVWGTERVYNTANTVTIQKSRLIDSALRGYMGARFDFIRDPSARRAGFNAFRYVHLHYNEMDPRNRIYSIYHRSGRTDWLKYYVGLPSRDWVDWYEPIRLEMAGRQKENVGKKKEVEIKRDESTRDKLEKLMDLHPDWTWHQYALDLKVTDHRARELGREIGKKMKKKEMDGRTILS